MGPELEPQPSVLEEEDKQEEQSSCKCVKDCYKRSKFEKILMRIVSGQNILNESPLKKKRKKNICNGNKSLTSIIVMNLSERKMYSYS